MITISRISAMQENFIKFKSFNLDASPYIRKLLREFPSDCSNTNEKDFFVLLGDLFSTLHGMEARTLELRFSALIVRGEAMIDQAYIFKILHALKYVKSGFNLKVFWADISLLRDPDYNKKISVVEKFYTFPRVCGDGPCC